MVLYFFSSDIPSLVIQVLRTVRHCKHTLPKTGLASLQRAACFCFFLGGERKTCYKHTHNVLTYSHSLLVVKKHKRMAVEVFFNLRHAISNL